MIVRTLEGTVGTELDVEAPTWRSRRLLLTADGMGFSLHDTVIDAGTETPMWYQNHFEAVYCVEGEGTVEEVDTGVVHEIVPGTMYALDQHDRHVLRARTRMRMVCVFNPPCTGQENHDENGTYPLLVLDKDGNVVAGSKVVTGGNVVASSGGGPAGDGAAAGAGAAGKGAP